MNDDGRRTLIYLGLIPLVWGAVLMTPAIVAFDSGVDSDERMVLDDPRASVAVGENVTEYDALTPTEQELFDEARQSDEAVDGMIYNTTYVEYNDEYYPIVYETEDPSYVPRAFILLFVFGTLFLAVGLVTTFSVLTSK